jgi:hypothetical protein
MITASGRHAAAMPSAWPGSLTASGSKSGSAAKTASRPWQKTR